LYNSAFGRLASASRTGLERELLTRPHRAGPSRSSAEVQGGARVAGALRVIWSGRCASSLAARAVSVQAHPSCAL